MSGPAGASDNPVFVSSVGPGGAPAASQTVVDQSEDFSAATGVVNCTTATQLFPSQTTPGLVTIGNQDSSLWIYWGHAAITAGMGVPIPPNGGVRSFRHANPSLIYVIGSSTVVASIER